MGASCSQSCLYVPYPESGVVTNGSHAELSCDRSVTNASHDYAEGEGAIFVKNYDTGAQPDLVEDHFSSNQSNGSSARRKRQLSEIDDLMKIAGRLKETQNEFDDLEKENDTLKDQLLEKEIIVSKHRESIFQLTEQLTTLGPKVDTLRQEREDLRKEMETLRENNDVLEKKNRELTIETGKTLMAPSRSNLTVRKQSTSDIEPDTLDYLPDIPEKTQPGAESCSEGATKTTDLSPNNTRSPSANRSGRTEQSPMKKSSAESNGSVNEQVNVTGSPPLAPQEPLEKEEESPPSPSTDGGGKAVIEQKPTLQAVSLEEQNSLATPIFHAQIEQEVDDLLS